MCRGSTTLSHHWMYVRALVKRVTNSRQFQRFNNENVPTFYEMGPDRLCHLPFPAFCFFSSSSLRAVGEKGEKTFCCSSYPTVASCVTFSRPPIFELDFIPLCRRLDRDTHTHTHTHTIQVVKERCPPSFDPAWLARCSREPAAMPPCPRSWWGRRPV